MNTRFVYYFHHGLRDFPHGAGASDIGWYVYKVTDRVLESEPSGPFTSVEDARSDIIDREISGE